MSGEEFFPFSGNMIACLAMEMPIYQVDTFASKLFRGNPAAVVPLDQFPSDEVLQAIAMENNLSETAFYAPEGDGLRLRWLTPVAEVDLCGHATMAAAFVYFQRDDPGAESVAFETRSGRIEVFRGPEHLTLDFPAYPPEPLVLPDGLADGLGATPAEVWVSHEHGSVHAVFEKESDIRGLNPVHDVLCGFPFPMFCASAPGDASDIVSRFFAPKIGVPEDPATGSAHCVLTPFWAKRLGKNSLFARQLSAREGELHCELRGDRVRISGRCVPYLEGKIFLPEGEA